MQSTPFKRTWDSTDENSSFIVYSDAQPPSRTPPRVKRPRVARTPLGATPRNPFADLNATPRPVHTSTPASTGPHATPQAGSISVALSEREEVEREAKLAHILHEIKSQGWTFFDFFDSFMKSKNQQHSSQASRALTYHAAEMLTSMKRRKPEAVWNWEVQDVADTLIREAKNLTKVLRPGDENLASFLENFSLEDVMCRVQQSSPTLWTILESMGKRENADSTRRNRELVYSTIACMIAQCRSERSNSFQQLMAFWLLAGGASKEQFDVLHHAGLCSSYSKLLRDLKELASQKLNEIRSIAKSSTIMIVWDNLNIAFKVAEQRENNKAHFDNGTTASVIVLEGIELGQLRNTMVPPRLYRRLSLEFSPSDILPTPEISKELDTTHLYHIIDILLDSFPNLRQRFGDDNHPPSKKQIPVHKTRQYPLPAMLLDESSLDGTLDVVNTIIQTTLQLSEEDVQRQGVIICAGDQLTMSLLDKASASRRDDATLLDNIGKWTENQPGLFHAFMNGTRMVGNEHWGTGNYSTPRQAPWSLWKVNNLLGRKNISCGWKAKQLAPFWPLQELILTFALPSNIIDGFRIHCGASDLKAWIATVKSFDEIREMALKVQIDLVNRRRVYKMRRKPDEERDVTLENIILFNSDALTLREFQHAVRTGDIGRVVNVLTFWLLAFRGTGSMPKYADMLFRTLMRLKYMDPTLREAFLMSWLVNVTGKPGRFKAVDLLQEHQNFWAKIIYMARGSNRSWKWLSMITLCIWALREVLRNVRLQYKARYNGKSHTSPDTQAEIAKLTQFLEAEKIQTFWPARPRNAQSVPVRDLIALGAAYFNSKSSFKQYHNEDINPPRKASYKKSSNVRSAPTATQETEGAPNLRTDEDDGSDSDGISKDNDDSEEEMWERMRELTAEELAMDTDEYVDSEDLQTLMELSQSIIDHLEIPS
ncbi:hypothetical protein SCHPADRAFT_999732 [Schizopora paradoxa]|uniref:DUF6589 domain-containing protein n=1 Tax=Schizopora paradoxa TaxID=27342 RepID=A0A0H2REE0_9AGAM|nr:hypothetical protein SCHPADRAFT_999732 [Schizopora paradoxa]